MAMARDDFSVWAVGLSARVKADARTHRGYRTLLSGEYDGKPGDAHKVAGGFQEPAEASDTAEEVLTRFGTPGTSYAELRHNGSPDPHTLIFLLEESTRREPIFGVWNTDHAKWPIFYRENMIEGYPEGFLPEEEGENGIEDDKADGFGKTDEDSRMMDLSNDGSEEDDDSDNLEEDEDADDGIEEDEADNEIDEEDEDAEDEKDADGEEESEEDDGEDEIEEDETDEEDAGDDDDEEDENDPEEDESDNKDEDTESDDETQEDSDSEEDDSEDDEEDEEAEEDEDESENESEPEPELEEEKELPRLKLFAKMRGPLGWRKRAELEELNDRNVWALKVGVLDPDEPKPAGQERNVFAQFEVIEKDENRKSATLRMKLPQGMTLDDFTMTKAGWITAEIPLPHEED